MNIVIDYGNSSAKVGIFDQYTLVEQKVYKDEAELKRYLENFSAANGIISTVNVPSEKIASWLRVEKSFVLSPSLPLPIKNLYGTPQTLGVDRIAGVCGGKQLFPDKPVLVIDAGTCVTYDFLDDQGNYLGGSIAPGLSMRFEAMHKLTARLPLVKVVNDPDLIGKSTETCMQSGAIWGMCFEIEGVISAYLEKFRGLQVILCGGDTRFFENKLKAPIFAVPELVLSGLNSILIHNVSR